MANQQALFTKQTIKRWESLVKSHLSKQVVKKTQDLMLNIIAVDVGLKPAYLYDIGHPEPNQLLALANILKDDSLVSSYLSVLKIGQDCLIVNPHSISMLNCEDLCFDCLINVSASLKSGPEIYRNQSAAQRIINGIKFISDNISSEKSVMFQIDENLCNVTSLFGILLNYPLIYWYEQLNGNSDNCLSLEKLTVIKVYMRYCSEIREKEISFAKHIQNPQEHCLYAFSYPSCLASDVSSKVTNWFSKLEEIVTKFDMFLGVSLTREEKTLQVVSL